MYNFCTLFDSNYLSRGLAMYESLASHCPKFHLYIFAFDNICYSYLSEHKLHNTTIISLEEFEDSDLLSIKHTRTKGEYCWTCTPSTILYCINKFKLPNCTYVDADLYFFCNPQILIDELTHKSVLITEHRYTPKYDQTKTSGIYCVQFITFLNNNDGLAVLNWWRNACLEWCFNRSEDGKFGDQKYLDDWPSRFSCIHILQNIGGGVAPWNMQQYRINNVCGKLCAIEMKTEVAFDICFFHFHGLKLLAKTKIDLSSYRIEANVIKYIYKPYVNHLLKIDNTIAKSKYAKKTPSISAIRKCWQMSVRIFKRKLCGTYNVYKISDFRSE